MPAGGGTPADNTGGNSNLIYILRTQDDNSSTLNHSGICALVRGAAASSDRETHGDREAKWLCFPQEKLDPMLLCTFQREGSGRHGAAGDGAGHSWRSRKVLPRQGDSYSRRVSSLLYMNQNNQ